MRGMKEMRRFRYLGVSDGGRLGSERRPYLRGEEGAR
jgi:hypothetical protein